MSTNPPAVTILIQQFGTHPKQETVNVSCKNNEEAKDAFDEAVEAAVNIRAEYAVETPEAVIGSENATKDDPTE